MRPGEKQSVATGGYEKGGLSLQVAALVLGLAAVVMLALYWTDARRASAAAPLPGAEEIEQGVALRAPLTAAAEGFLSRPVTIEFASGERAAGEAKDEKQAAPSSMPATWRDLGLVVDEGMVAREAARLEAAGVDAASLTPESLVEGKDVRVPVILDRARAVEALMEVKDRLDRHPVDARVDLEHRTVIDEKPGYGIDVYASLARVEAAAQRAAGSVELVGGDIPPHTTRAELGDIDVSHVMGWFETKYNTRDTDRNHNLMVGAEKLNGYVIKPGEAFSFNEIVGERTEKQGYHVAHVIEAGEMVDGLAGGMCQISSTLHGAAWFAGLELTYAIPHSRPSAYVTMGMDATVNWPTIDVKLRNPYEFPVVLRYVVSRGITRVEILGKKRPYDRIEFVREVKQETPYQTITREDPTIPVGTTVVEQVGFPGYVLDRYRVFYRGGKVVKQEKKEIKYPPTTEYIRIGSNPDPNLLPPPQENVKGLKPDKPNFKFGQ